MVRVKTVADAPRQYQAAYELPAEIDAEATAAKLENGVLTLTLAKKKPVVTSRSSKSSNPGFDGGLRAAFSRARSRLAIGRPR